MAGNAPPGIERVRILSFQSGPHDASAAAFEDYRLIAAVQEERLRGGEEWGRRRALARYRRSAAHRRLVALRRRRDRAHSRHFPGALSALPAAARSVLH